MWSRRFRTISVSYTHLDVYKRQALECAAAGVDKIRINPGNIGDQDRVKAVANACRNRHIPIRIGVNGGSLEKEILAKYGSPTAEALRDSALDVYKRQHPHPIFAPISATEAGQRHTPPPMRKSNWPSDAVVCWGWILLE